MKEQNVIIDSELAFRINRALRETERAKREGKTPTEILAIQRQTLREQVKP